jgi:hypothetical protein
LAPEPEPDPAVPDEPLSPEPEPEPLPVREDPLAPVEPFVGTFTGQLTLCL